MAEHDPPLPDSGAGKLVYLVESLTSLHAATDMAWLAGRFEFLGEHALGAALTALILPDETHAYRAAASASPRPATARDLWEQLGVKDLAENEAAAAVFGEAESHSRAVRSTVGELFPDAQYAGGDDALVAPIAFNRELIGVGLFILQPDEMSEAMAMMLATHAAVAIHQLREREEARRLHSMDARLWVPDEAFLIAQLQREVARARRYGRASGIALLRLENEGAVRAQFGDFYADHVMRRIGSQLLASVRDSDVVGALAGGYAVIHTETSRDGTQLSAERLSDAATKMVAQRFPEAPAVQISVRAVAYPEDGATVEDLLRELEQGAGERANDFAA